MRVLALLLVCWGIGCAPSLPPAYQRSRAAAERAYAAGRYEEAAGHWQAARKSAERRRDQADALYREAASLRRAGLHEQARERLRALVRDYPRSHRADRARYDLADLNIEHGDRGAGYEELRQFFHRHPDSPLAPRALTRYVRWLSDGRGDEAALSFLSSAERALGETPLGEELLYRMARTLERLERWQEACRRYLSLAERYPYPQGAYWDDALWYAAQIDAQSGHPAQAIAHLERMLGEREAAHLQGSYQKPRYGEARFRIAELTRDGLEDSPRALDEFRRVFTDHPTSLLRDDALWEEAKLARKLGNGARACNAIELLAKELPDSRYAACAKLVCPSTSRHPRRECRAYLARQLTEP